MPTNTATDPTPKTIPLTLEDVAHLADGSGEHPDDTAARLKVFIRCDDPDRVRHTWRLIGSHREASSCTLRAAWVFPVPEVPLTRVVLPIGSPP